VIRLAVERAGAHKVMLGADWPTEDFEVEIKKIEMAVTDPADRKLVLGENAQRLFNLS
jgi:predicted TIM-barrel fold metal-dependent hydrolase